jgi:FKBP-type peptidyl-prolyl cis-trans isomerase FkpA
MVLTACPAAEAKSAAQKTLYAAGADAAERILDEYQLTPKEARQLMKGFQDALLKKKLSVDVKDYRGKVRQLHLDRQEARRKSFLDKAAARPGARRFESGLVYREIKAGAGPKPSSTDRVKVHYHGTFPDGKVFDSSVQRGQPSSFPLNGVISCWTEGVQKMSIGTKAELICPYPIAYGSRGRPPKIPARSTLVFEVELLDILK